MAYDANESVGFEYINEVRYTNARFRSERFDELGLNVQRLYKDNGTTTPTFLGARLVRGNEL